MSYKLQILISKKSIGIRLRQLIIQGCETRKIRLINKL